MARPWVAAVAVAAAVSTGCSAGTAYDLTRTQGQLLVQDRYGDIHAVSATA